MLWFIPALLLIGVLMKVSQGVFQPCSYKSLRLLRFSDSHSSFVIIFQFFTIWLTLINWRLDRRPNNWEMVLMLTMKNRLRSLHLLLTLKAVFINLVLSQLEDFKSPNFPVNMDVGIKLNQIWGGFVRNTRKWGRNTKAWHKVIFTTTFSH